MYENQENICPPNLRGSFTSNIARANVSLQAEGKGFAKTTQKPRGGGTFGKLLNDATNIVREESDSQLAFEVQTDEACDVVMSWIREGKNKDPSPKKKEPSALTTTTLFVMIQRVMQK